VADETITTKVEAVGEAESAVVATNNGEEIKKPNDA